MKHFLQLMASKSRIWISRSGLRSQRGTDGGALVEMAVTLPFILFLMTGIFTFTVALYQKLMLSEAVSVGGRTLSVARGQDDPCALTVAALKGAGPGLDPTKLTVSININGTAYTSGSCTAASSMPYGKSASLSVSYPCSLSVFGMSPLVPYGFKSACTMRSQITEMIQ